MRIRAVLLVVAALTLIPAGPPGRAADASATVFESNILFCDTPVCAPGVSDSSDVTIAEGGTVTWVFDDALCVAFGALGCAHIVESTTEAFPDAPSQSVASPAPVTLTFGSAGTYAYVCEIHGAVMHGVVHVV